MRTTWGQPTLAAGASGLLAIVALGPVAPVGALTGPGDEVAWEQGVSGTVHDGDTVDVSVRDSSSGLTGTQRVRTIGIQAPEVRHDGQQAQCGSSQASSALRALLPAGTAVQLRSLEAVSGDRYSGGRIVRSIYALDDEGNWFDTSRQLVSDGTVLWFPLSTASSLKPEYAHNLEYRVLAEDAQAAGRGLWKANLCGTSPSPAATLRLAVSWDQSIDGYEKVFVVNGSASAVPVAGWILRDSALNKYRFPRGASIPAGGSIEVRLARGTDDPARGVFYTGSSATWFTNLPTPNPDFVGDAAYLMDDAGSYETGNLRAWAAYPCAPDDCTDPLRGRVEIGTVDRDAGQDVPSPPRDVVATGAPDGSGAVVVSWRSPSSVGDEVGVTGYRVTATSGGGSSHVDVSSSARSATLTHLAVGQGHTITVSARNAQGWSAASPGAGPVVPRVGPGAPRSVTAAAVPSGVAVRWAAPADDGGSPVTGYTVSAAGSDASCATSGPEQSCVVTGLAEGVESTFTVRATNAVGTSRASDPSDPVTPGGAQWPLVPGDVSATPRDGSVVVTWAPAAPAAAQPSGYVVTALAGDAAAGSCSPVGQETSCVIPGLVNAVAHTVVVRVAVEGSTASAPVTVTPVQDTRVASDAAPASPSPAAWARRETVTLHNLTASAIRLVGYGLWDKDPRGGTDTPDYVFGRDAAIPAGATLRVRSGAPTTVEPASATLLYTRRTPIYSTSGDLVELSGLDRAPVACELTSGTACATTADAVAPTQPLGVTARTTPTSVTVSWGVPIARGGSPITGYTATSHDAANDGAVLGTCSTTGSGRSCRMAASVGRTYYVEVTATNAAGTSAPSAPRAHAAPRTAPSAPVTVSVTGTPGGARVTWSAAAPNGATVTGYAAEARTTPTGGAAVARCTAAAGLSGCTLGGLRTGRRYYVTVTATNRAGTSAPSSPGQPVTPPAAASPASSYASGRVTARWQAPAALGSPVTGFTATLMTAATGGTVVGRCTASAAATSCVATTTSRRSAYYVHLAAQTSVGAATTAPLAVTGPATRPSAPVTVRARASGHRVIVAWSAPDRDGFAAITGYRATVHSRASGGRVSTRCSTTAATCRTRTLRRGTYWVSVRARNAAGWSSAQPTRVRVRVR